jgi:hypothetical protein
MRPPYIQEALFPLHLLIALTIVPMALSAACASSRKADQGTDGTKLDGTKPGSITDTVPDRVDSMIEGVNPDAAVSDHGADRDSEAEWINALREWVDPQLDAEAQPLVPKVKIEAVLAGDIPVGQWLGQAGAGQNKGCLDSKRVEIQIASSENGETAIGVVTVGDKTPPPPATDPEVGYPPGFLADLYTNGVCYFNNLVDGFPYSIRDGRVYENGRFVFRVAVAEIYQTWCSLQTSYPRDTDSTPGPESYKCMPKLSNDEVEACSKLSEALYVDSSTPSTPLEGLKCPVDLGKFALCFADLSGPCICDEQKCWAPMNLTIQFDLTFDRDTMQGVITNLFPGDVSTPAEVRLRKVE